MACSSCGSSSIEYNDAFGSSICTSCGTVVEENVIVSEVTFGEKQNGAAVLQGTFVAAGQGRASFLGPYRRQNALEAKEQSIRNGRDAIHRISTALRISERYADAAQRYFNLALAHNFTRGRKTEFVAASCLYIACRVDKTSHMLIDFSEILQLNVYVLGATFLDLITVLRIKLPVVDPALYVNRFAGMMDLGAKTDVVARDANLLVARMNIDWIRTGRRPAGICGACLLIAARMHGFRRTEKEMMRIVKIGEITLKKRLVEFAETPSSQLTVNNFRVVHLQQAENPPAFKVAKRKITEESEAVEELDVLGLLQNSTTDKEDAQDTPASKSPVVDLEEVDHDVAAWTDLDDEEIESLLLTEQEHKVKEKLWLSENQEYLLQVQLRQKDEGLPKKKKKRVAAKKPAPGAENLAEAALHALGPTVQKFSSKVNYDALNQIMERQTVDPIHSKNLRTFTQIIAPEEDFEEDEFEDEDEFPLPGRQSEIVADGYSDGGYDDLGDD